MKYRISFGVLFLLCASICVPAQTDQASRAPARLDELHEKGSEALLNLDYDKARQTFKEIARLFPDDPTGPEMLAWTLWLESLNRARLRQAAIYSTQSFEANSEDKPDPQVTQEFRDLIRQATQLTRVRLQANPHDPRALYTLGDVETLHAAYEITIEGRFLAGLRDGSSGVDKHREVIKLDPNFHDAELSIGLYDYIVGNLPLAAKVIANVSGVHGSKRRGLQTLERVANSGQWQRDNARLLLMVLYKHEKRFGESLALSRTLQEKYSRNYLFKLETADAFVSQATIERQQNHIAAADDLEKEALGVFGSLMRDYSPSSARRALGVIHFRYGEDLLALRQPERAAQQFLAVTVVADVDPSLITRTHLRAAQSFDLSGKRNEALAEYRIVLSRTNTRDSLEQARRGLKEPYRGK
jgi:tetratricopeptide (TPR) repeat protein